MAIHEIARLAINATLAGVAQTVNRLNKDEYEDNIWVQLEVFEVGLFR